jgi:hypothetical protein
MSDTPKRTMPADGGHVSPRRRGAKGQADVTNAFDTWLDRQLHQMFDRVAKEPIPEDLLRLIEGDKRKQEP